MIALLVMSFLEPLELGGQCRIQLLACFVSYLVGRFEYCLHTRLGAQRAGRLSGSSSDFETYTGIVAKRGSMNKRRL